MISSSSGFDPKHLSLRYEESLHPVIKNLSIGKALTVLHSVLNCYFLEQELRNNSKLASSWNLEAEILEMKQKDGVRVSEDSITRKVLGI